MSGSNGNGHAKGATAAAEAPQEFQVRQFNVTITSTGRPAVVILPVEASDAEIGEVCGWILTAVMNTYRSERAAKPPIEIARVMPTPEAGG